MADFIHICLFLFLAHYVCFSWVVILILFVFLPFYRVLYAYTYFFFYETLQQWNIHSKLGLHQPGAT